MQWKGKIPGSESSCSISNMFHIVGNSTLAPIYLIFLRSAAGSHLQEVALPQGEGGLGAAPEDGGALGLLQDPSERRFPTPKQEPRPQHKDPSYKQSA